MLQNFFGFYFDFSGIFWIYFLIKNRKKGLYIHAGPAKLTWHNAHKWHCHADTRKRLHGAKDFGLAYDGPMG